MTKRKGTKILPHFDPAIDMTEQRTVGNLSFRAEDLVKNEFINLIAQQCVRESGRIAVGLFTKPFHVLLSEGIEPFGT